MATFSYARVSGADQYKDRQMTAMSEYPYFEIDAPDELRKKGVSKEHRPDPIIQMGLFMDANGIPLSISLKTISRHGQSTCLGKSASKPTS